MIARDKLCILCIFPALPNSSVCENHSNSTAYADFLEKRKSRNEEVSVFYKTVHGRFLKAKGSAKARGIRWLLTEAHFETLGKESCFYCKQSLNLKFGSGIDRKNSSRDYEPNNVVACCIECNVAKNNFFSCEEMQVIGKAISIVKQLRLLGPIETPNHISRDLTDLSTWNFELSAKLNSSDTESRVENNQMENSEYAKKLDEASLIINKYNESSQNKIEINNFIQCLKDSGGTTIETLRFATWEDLQDCKLPKILARQVADIFRTKETRSKVFTERRIEGMSHKELLEAYDPKNSDNAVGAKLSALSKGEPIIVFNSDGKVNIKASFDCLTDIRSGLSSVDITSFEGLPFKVFKVGENLVSCLDENPLYPGSPLRGEAQKCNYTNRSWSGISNEVRVLLRLAIITREIIINGVPDVHDIMDMVLRIRQGEDMTNLYQRYPHAYLKFKELGPLGKLPVLKISSDTQKKNNPFGNVTY